MDRYKIVRRAGRRFLLIRWHDGCQWRERSSGKTRRRDALKVAERLALEHAEGPDDDWVDFKATYMADHMADQSTCYLSVFNSAAAKLEQHTSVKRVSQITPQMLAKFPTAMRADGAKPATIATYLVHLRGALNWAHRHGYLEQPVRVEIPRPPKGSKVMKGRPLTGEEFERWLQAVSKVLGDHAPSLQDFMQGLWLSGLRIGELFLMSWDECDGLLITNLEGRRPMIEIPATLDKGRIQRTHPVTPDFVEFLRRRPLRVGRVFRPLGKSGRLINSADRAGKLISKAGRVSKIITGKGKHPTAHDLRRSFGSRWSLRVMPAVLKELMRHEDIETTMAFYVGQSAERTANEVWDAFVCAEGGVLGGATQKIQKRGSNTSLGCQRTYVVGPTGFEPATF